MLLNPQDHYSLKQIDQIEQPLVNGSWFGKRIAKRNGDNLRTMDCRHYVKPTGQCEFNRRSAEPGRENSIER